MCNLLITTSVTNIAVIWFCHTTVPVHCVFTRLVHHDAITCVRSISALLICSGFLD